MKKIAFLLIVAVLLCAAPIMAADGAFTDVPSDHWAYDAVNTLAQAGLVQGYPDGTFSGKRTMSRYEFAMVIARLLPLIHQGATTPAAAGLNKSDVEAMLNDYAKKSEIPAFSGATKADVADAIAKLSNEFRDELTQMGVDVDSLKKDVAALNDRVAAVEAEQARVRFTGNVNIIAKTTVNTGDNTAFDLDGNAISTDAAALRDINIYRDMNLNIKGRVNDKTTASATINYGNYLNSLNNFGDFSGSAFESSSDQFTPYYMYVRSDVGFGKLTVGRFPFQLGSYTFKMVDPDSYTTLAMTDSGNIPVDGAQLKANFFGFDWTLFAAQDSNVNNNIFFAAVPFTQFAGAKVNINAPLKSKIGLTYYQGWDKDSYKTGYADVMDVYSADLNLPLSYVTLSGTWAKSKLSDMNGVQDNDDQAIDGKLAGKVGSVALDAGYKWIGADYVAPGFWDTIGRAKNPTNIKGVTANASTKIGSFAVNAGAELLQPKNTLDGMNTDDNINKYVAGVKWGYAKTASIGVDYQLVQFDLTGNSDKPKEQYVTVNWNKSLGENTNLKVGYQFIKYDAANQESSPYGPDYEGGLGVVQLGVNF